MAQAAQAKQVSKVATTGAEATVEPTRSCSSGWALPGRHAGTEIFGNGQAGNQGRLLPDDREPEAARRFGVRQGLLANDGDASTVGDEGARRHSPEGEFARAVFSDETVDFARGHRERNVVRCPHAGKGLRDPIDLQK